MHHKIFTRIFASEIDITSWVSSAPNRLQIFILDCVFQLLFIDSFTMLWDLRILFYFLPLLEVFTVESRTSPFHNSHSQRLCAHTCVCEQAYTDTRVNLRIPFSSSPLAMFTERTFSEQKKSFTNSMGVTPPSNTISIVHIVSQIMCLNVSDNHVSITVVWSWAPTFNCRCLH